MRCITANAPNETPSRGAVANRRPAGQSDGSDNLAAAGVPTSRGTESSQRVVYTSAGRITELD